MLIAPGYIFTDGVEDDGSSEHLAQFLASCTITGIGITDFDSSSHLVQVSATPPLTDQGLGSLWFDTTTNLFRQLNDDRWDCAYEGPDLLNDTGATIPKGSLVVMDGAGKIKPCVTGSSGEVVGVTTEDVLDGDRTILGGSGVVEILVWGPSNPGDVLISDALSGYARAATLTYGAGAWTGGIEVGIAPIGVGFGSPTGLVTCIGWM